MAARDVKLGDHVVYVCGEVLTRADTAEVHAGHSMGGSRTPGKELLGIVTKAASAPERDDEPFKVDLAVVKNDPDQDLPDFGANVVIIHEVPYDADGGYNSFHFEGEGAAAK